MLLLKVNDDVKVTDDVIKRALKDTFTKAGCSHDYDCCGCRSTYVTSVTYVDLENRKWVVLTHSSRNY